MSTKKITQTEAIFLRKRVTLLESYIRKLRFRWSREWVEGKEITYLGSAKVDDTLYSSVLTALKLKHAVIVSTHNNEIQFMADYIQALEDI